jgi:hypothetical protein
MSLLPFVASWLCVVADEPLWGAGLLGFGLIWRSLVDWSSLPQYWPAEERRQTVFLKAIWCVAASTWLASLVVIAWAMILGIFLLFALLAGGRSAKRRSN